jgi:hypothetical protein
VKYVGALRCSHLTLPGCKTTLLEPAFGTPDPNLADGSHWTRRWRKADSNSERPWLCGFRKETIAGMRRNGAGYCVQAVSVCVSPAMPPLVGECLFLKVTVRMEHLFAALVAPDP